jgi:hypothetical protein
MADKVKLKKVYQQKLPRKAYLVTQIRFQRFWLAVKSCNFKNKFQGIHNTYRIQNSRFIKYLKRVIAVAIAVPPVKIKMSTIILVPTKANKRKTLIETV